MPRQTGHVRTEAGAAQTLRAAREHVSEKINITPLKTILLV